MAFSGSTDFSYTRDQIIFAALRKCRAYDTDGGSPEAYQTRDAAEALNLILKRLQLEGTLLWVQQDVEVNLAKGKASYTIGPTGYVTTSRPLRIFDPMIRDISDDSDVPLDPYSKMDYANLTNKTATGKPSAIYYSRQINDGIIYVWPVPDSSKYKLKVTAEVQLQDFDASGNTAYMPSYAYSYFVWALAAEIAPEYGLDLQEQQLLEVKAERFKTDLLAFEEEEDGFQFIPDSTSYGMVR
jgi:hypothetical protein